MQAEIRKREKLGTAYAQLAVQYGTNKKLIVDLKAGMT